MGLKEFRDDWETWSKGKKVVSIIIGCCVLSLVFAAVAGLFAPDANTYDDTSTSTSTDSDGPFIIDAENIKVKSSSLDKTHQQTKSSSYAYFYEDTGAYAEAAYTTYNAEEYNIKIDLNKIKLSNDSVLEYSQFFADPEVYNETDLVDDITKLVKSDDVSIVMDFYDKKDNLESSFYNLKPSVKDGILTLKYSNSSTSDYHVKYTDSNPDIHHARVTISGMINGTNSSRMLDFHLVTAKMKVKTHY